MVAGAGSRHRGPLVYTFPSSAVKMTVLNATSFGMVHSTSVTPDATKSFQIALHMPTKDSLTFGGFAALATTPFD